MTTHVEIAAIAYPQLQRDEGFVAHAMPDVLTGGAPWTVGFGCTGPDIGPTTVWTFRQGCVELAKRIDALMVRMDTAIPGWTEPVAPRCAVLVNVAYNCGLHGLLEFRGTLAAYAAGDWDGAAQHLYGSRVAQANRGLAARYGRLATQLRTGLAT